MRKESPLLQASYGKYIRVFAVYDALQRAHGRVRRYLKSLNTRALDEKWHA